jgi:hypothetical protein
LDLVLFFPGFSPPLPQESKLRLLAISGRSDLVVVSGWFNEQPAHPDIVGYAKREFSCPLIGSSDRDSLRDHLMELGCHKVYPKSETADQAYKISELWHNLLASSRKEPGEFYQIIEARAAALGISFLEALDDLDKEIDQHHCEVVLQAECS